MVTTQALPLRQMRDFDASGESIHADSPQIAAVLDNFHAGNGTRPQEAEHGIPVIRRTITQPQSHAGFRASPRSLSSQRARAAGERGSEISH